MYRSVYSVLFVILYMTWLTISALCGSYMTCLPKLCSLPGHKGAPLSNEPLYRHHYGNNRYSVAHVFGENEHSSNHQSCASSVSLIQAHAALKWFHPFVPSLDHNLLDSEFCKNLIESAKRIKSKPIAKKKPFSSQIIKDILDAYNKQDANVKDVRITALCSLAFAGFFRYNELCNIAPNHIEFHSQYIKILVPRSKTDVYREGNFVIRRIFADVIVYIFPQQHTTYLIEAVAVYMS